MSPVLLLTEPISCPEDVNCVPPIQCPAHLWMLESERPTVCALKDGSPGYCCTTGQNHTTPAYLKKYFQKQAKYDIVDVNSIYEEAEQQLNALSLGSTHHKSRRDASFHHSLLAGSHDPARQARGIQDVIASKIFHDR